MADRIFETPVVIAVVALAWRVSHVVEALVPSAYLFPYN
jgi:hypothetical protein